MMILSIDICTQDITIRCEVYVLIRQSFYRLQNIGQIKERKFPFDYTSNELSALHLCSNCLRFYWFFHRRSLEWIICFRKTMQCDCMSSSNIISSSIKTHCLNWIVPVVAIIARRRHWNCTSGQRICSKWLRIGDRLVVHSKRRPVYIPNVVLCTTLLQVMSMRPIAIRRYKNSRDIFNFEPINLNQKQKNPTDRSEWGDYMFDESHRNLYRDGPLFNSCQTSSINCWNVWRRSQWPGKLSGVFLQRCVNIEKLFFRLSATCRSTLRKCSRLFPRWRVHQFGKQMHDQSGPICRPIGRLWQSYPNIRTGRSGSYARVDHNFWFV